MEGMKRERSGLWLLWERMLRVIESKVVEGSVVLELG